MHGGNEKPPPSRAAASLLTGANDWNQPPNTSTPFMMAQWPGKEQKKV